MRREGVVLAGVGLVVVARAQPPAEEEDAVGEPVEPGERGEAGADAAGGEGLDVRVGGLREELRREFGGGDDDEDGADVEHGQLDERGAPPLGEEAMRAERQSEQRTRAEQSPEPTWRRAGAAAASWDGARDLAPRARRLARADELLVAAWIARRRPAWRA